MKNKLLKLSLLSTSLLFTASYVNNALAHEQSGSLGKAAGSTDLYIVTCSDNGSGPSARLGIQVIDLAPAAAPKVSVQAIRGVKAVTSTDNKDGDAKFSPIVYNYSGDGQYFVTVSKTASGVENYALDFHCQDASGMIHTGTDIAQMQNQ